MSEFSTTFSSLTGNPPFPWQEDLYNNWFSKGEMPSRCDIPTGLGKTSVVATWLIALANGAKVPRRLVYVVNRRTVVDQTTNEVERLRTTIHQAGLHVPLNALCAIPLGNGESPLAISTLRGQFADNREWLADPARPAVIVGTVDMIGSRLLFNGYRAGSWQLARHAGLIGQDVLLVHDEAHLEPAFQKLVEGVEARQKHDGCLRPLRVMAMSATGRTKANNNDQQVLVLSDQDRAHPDVKQRYSEVRKVLHLHQPDTNKLPDQLLELAWQHADAKVRVIVYIQKPDVAAQVHVGLLAKLNGDAERVNCVALLTGTIRAYERDQLVAHPAVAGLLRSHDVEGQRTVPQCTTWLVSTSAGEVGADFDADHLVCDISPIDSMIQRFGRVNRRGGAGRTARIDVVLARPESKKGKDGKEKKVSEFEQAQLVTSDLLKKLPKIDQEATADPESRKASPEVLRNLAQSYSDDYTKSCTPEPPSDTPHDVVLDAWSLTSIQDDWPLCHDVHPYLHGLDPQAPETVIAWRAEIDELPNDEQASPEEVEKTMRSVLRHYPLWPLELLRDKPQQVAKLLVALRERTPKDWVVLLHQRSLSAMRLKDLDGDSKAIAPQLYYRTVLLPPSLGGLTAAGILDPGANDRVRDIADLAPSKDGKEGSAVRRRAVLTRDDEDRWRSRILGYAAPPPEAGEGEPATTYSKLADVRQALAKSLGMTCEARCDLAKDDRGPTRVLLLFQASKPAPIGQNAARVTIEAHNRAVAEAANYMTARLKLESFLQVLQTAAGAHDLGKADPRWQQAIYNENGSEPLAKSFGKIFNWKVLDGYRHEFGSLRKTVNISLDDEARDLILHLIAAHHGRGRPHFDLHAMADDSGLLDGLVEQLPELLRPSEVARRFACLQRRYGHWGLAWMEAILMAADAAGSQAPTDTAPDEVEKDEE